MKLPSFLYPSLFLAAAATPAPAPAPAPGQSPLQGFPHLGHLPVIMPISGSGRDGQVQPAVLLSDILGTQRSLTTFFSLSRLHESTTELLSDPKINTTVLAPSNAVIEGLPRKPWEDARELAVLGSQAYDGSGGKDRADQNLRKFIEAHLVVGTSPWEAGVKAKTALGREIWWESKKDGKDGEKRVILPDRVEVERVASQVANGEVWILKGVLNHV